MASIADALVSKLSEALFDLIKDEVSMMLGVKDDLRRLQKKVGMFNSVNLQDAEFKAFSDPAIRTWLADLKDIVYDAEDLMDECRIRAHIQKEEGATISRVRCCSPLLSCFRGGAFRHQIGTRIKSINERLATVLKDKADLNLIATAAASDPAKMSRRDPGSSSSSVSRQTDPILEPNIVGMGIENNTAELVSRLTQDDGGPAISVIAIVGMGGIGKTTLAQKIFNHKTIKDAFMAPPPMWVCVSKDYSGTKLIKEMIRCGGADPGNAQSLGELKPMLGRALQHKKFFLVLDDVWSADVWLNLLQKPLLMGSQGSRVLITTRDAEVAMKMGAVQPYHEVHRLSDEDGWLLLRKTVFQENEEGIKNVEDIGMQIVKKCAGLPLALKTVAGVLTSKDRTRQEWEMVLRNPAWSLTDLPDGVMGALLLSYQDLPFHLKQCFIYCSLLAEDQIIRRRYFINCWVAEGFVSKEEDHMIMEDVAKGYYSDLIRRCLLQPDPTYYRNAGCRVHDLLLSLAQFLSRDENFVGDEMGLVKVSSSTNLRRLLIRDEKLTTIPEIIAQHKSLRMLRFVKTPLTEVVDGDIFRNLGRLRVLEFEDTNLKRLPDSIGHLMHLRFLCIWNSDAEELPETIVSLHSLQFLILGECQKLRRLPQGIVKLHNLRCLEIHESSVDELPAGIGRLQHLNHLLGFIANEREDNNEKGREREQQNKPCSLQELTSLSQLRELSVEKLERALLVGGNARGVLIKDKRYLRYLWLRCTLKGAEELPFREEEMKKIQQVFEEELSPPPSLETLDIRGYFGVQYPSWIMKSIDISTLVNLRRLDLTKCIYCVQLPPLGLLPNLDYLHINGADAIKRIGPEFMGFFFSSNADVRVQVITSFPPHHIPFPKLEDLILEDMPHWEEWVWEAEERAMPRLQTLALINCPKLRDLPEGLCRHANALIRVHIVEANSLSAFGDFDSVKELTVEVNSNLRRISNLPALQMLEVNDCTALREVEDLQSLQSLILVDTEMESLPEWLLPSGGGQVQAPLLFPVLERVQITVGGVDVLRRCLVDGPDWPKIQHLSNVRIQVDQGPQFVHYTRDPFNFNSNLDGRNDDDDSRQIVSF